MKVSLLFAIFSIFLTISLSNAANICSLCKCEGVTVICQSVKNVNFDNALLKTIPKDTENLKIIDCYMKTLTKDGLSHLDMLVELDLSFNKIETIEAGAFNGNEFLIWLNLNNNLLTTFPKGLFDKHVDLESLTFSFNKLNGNLIPSDLLKNQSKLQMLDIAINPLGKIPDGFFKKLTSLTYLSAYETSLTEIASGTFNNNKKLETLELNENTIRSLPDDMFKYLTNLKSLGLSMNWLQKLPVGLEKLKKVKTINFGENAGYYCRPFDIPRGAVSDIDKCGKVDRQQYHN